MSYIKGASASVVVPSVAEPSEKPPDDVIRFVPVTSVTSWSMQLT